jgi:hypothetical protein
VTRRIAISTPFNGAEYLELEAGCAKDGARSLPQYARLRCGLAATLVTKRGSSTESRRIPVRLALERRTVTITVDGAEHVELDAGATVAGLSISRYIRTRCGFLVRWSSLPNTENRDREEDDAWERLQQLGLHPEEYFPRED